MIILVLTCISSCLICFILALFYFLLIEQGNTVAAMGSFKGLKQVRRVVEDCLQNKMHPVYHIKVNRLAWCDSTIAKLHS